MTSHLLEQAGHLRKRSSVRFRLLPSELWYVVDVLF